MTHLKYVFSSLKKDFSRLIAIIIIVLLGIGFMAGLLQAGVDLQESEDKFYKESKLADIRLSLSTGISLESYEQIINEVNNVASISKEVSYESNVIYNNSVSNYSLIYQRELTKEVDKLQIIEGRLPNNAFEAVVLTDNINYINYELGSTLKIQENDQEFTVVGKAISSEYITKQIVNSLTTGRRLQNIFYFDITYFDSPIYTALNFNYDLSISTYDDEYIKIIDQQIENLKHIINDIFLVNNAKNILRPTAITSFDSFLISQGMSEEALTIYKTTEEYQNGLSSFLDATYDAYIEEYGEVLTYYLTREECYSYVMLKNDIQKVITVSTIFPLFFFLIAMLVASTSISRIITKDRSLMGTFKGIGLSNTKIRNKYIFYGILSTIIGTALGLFIGLFLLTYVIYVCYKSIYIIPSFVFGLSPSNIIFVVLLMFIFIMGVILFYTFKTLREKPSQLMMEKAPKPGKKILLERIKPLWNLFPFGIKNMFRNVFRFKKNLIMMIIGVGGSTALMVAGFGMRDSIFVLTNDQYVDIFKYNFIVETQNEEILLNFDFGEQINYTPGATIDNETTYAFNILCGDNLDEYIKIDGDFNDNSVYVTETIAEHFNLKINDEIQFTSNNKIYTYTLSGITENYVGNYMYLGNSYNEDFKQNAIIGYLALQEENVDSFISNLFQNEGVTNVIYTGDSISVYDGLLKNLNYIVVILILLSGLLMVTVIYNLVDINISERKKEIATLKVIGYHRHELIMYIFREILLMTFIAVSFGLGFGVILHHYIVKAINSPNLMFALNIAWTSYIYTIALSIVFSIIVTAMLIPKILKVDMVESLKSVD